MYTEENKLLRRKYVQAGNVCNWIQVWVDDINIHRFSVMPNQNVYVFVAVSALQIIR